MEDLYPVFIALRGLRPEVSWRQNLRAMLEGLAGDEELVTPPAVIRLTFMRKVEAWHLGN
ncbi:hypothetical protein HY442_01665 [Candidatus Parcubacteria bacterium]|nr:hypothetical protein [Candidatus Parcubacteria bacterium]MBI4099219.1 hypothetical protein [Candidatus Parcubacteria bacterium]MBI4385210.1 hypothetical protein [Candidatus Parcubacteria bacterium]